MFLVSRRSRRFMNEKDRPLPPLLARVNGQIEVNTYELCDLILKLLKFMSNQVVSGLILDSFMLDPSQVKSGLIVESFIFKSSQVMSGLIMKSLALNLSGVMSGLLYLYDFLEV